MWTKPNSVVIFFVILIFSLWLFCYWAFVIQALIMPIGTAYIAIKTKAPYFSKNTSM